MAALRRLVYGQGATKNWTLEETNTYDSGDPADSPSAWASPENMEQDFRATTNGNAALGALITFTETPDGFGGVLAKVAVTYGVGETPSIEMWTLSGSTWTVRRRISVSNLDTGAPSTERKVYNLLMGLQRDEIDAVWVTVVPTNPGTSTETAEWFCIHPYGSCDTDFTISPCPRFDNDCPPGYGCLDPNDWTEDPDCEVNSDDDEDADFDFEFPPIVLEIPGEAVEKYGFRTATTPGWGLIRSCPGNGLIAGGFTMTFGLDAADEMDVIFVPKIGQTLLFTDDFDNPADPAIPVTTTTFPVPVVLPLGPTLNVRGQKQTITGPGIMSWAVKEGTGFVPQFPSSADTFPGRYLDRPDEYGTVSAGIATGTGDRKTYTFVFVPRGVMSFARLLDILSFFWTTELRYLDLCT